jgi:DNA (cytosine-5)-methyltransferase 1
MHSELCPSLKARDAKGPSSDGDGDGDGDGAILVPMVQPIATHDVAGTMLSRNTSGGFSNSIDHAAAGYMALQPIALAENTIGRKPENGGNGDGFTEEGPMYTLNATGVHGVAQPITQFGNIAGTLTKRYDSSACADRGQNVLAQPIGAFKPGQSASAHSIGYESEMAPTLEAGEGGNNKPAVHVGMAVRRLTPKECERLQGFPDNYTDIKPKGKATPDGPRYKALGNSMAVPVMAWIGERIAQVEKILNAP